MQKEATELRQGVGFQKQKGSNMTTATTEKPTYEPGSWQDTLFKSASLLDRSNKGRAKASALLWTGAQTAIEEWLDNSDEDVQGEALTSDLLDILGKDRKGDVSKIKTVALAVKSAGLVLGTWDNLSKAYAEAKRLTVTVQNNADEDTAADEAVQAIEPPKTASTVEAAAKILLSKGVDEAVRVILDVLNGVSEDVQNTPAHRSFLRAVAQEINGRATAEADAAKAKADAEREAKREAAAKVKAEADAAKAKPAKKAAAKKTAAPAKKTAAKPKPAAKKAAAAAPVEEPVDEDESGEEIADLFEDETGEVEPDGIDDLLDEVGDEPVVEAPVAKKATPKPARRGPVRR